MALSATFSADFSNFQAAVVKAELSLKGFEDSAGKVGTSLNRMGDSFSGVKVVQQATLMASAVAKLGGEAGITGGILKLTDAELQRLGDSASAAATKLKVLAQAEGDVSEKLKLQGQSAEFTRIADAAKAATSSIGGIHAPVDGLLGSVSKLAGAFGLAFTGAAVVSGIKNLIGNVLDTASAIHDQSAALGFSTEAFQRNVFAAEQSGGSLEAFSKAANKLNDNLANGSQSTVAALTKAGLKFDEIRKMAPEQAWAKVTDAVGKIEDPMTRAAVAQDLFGKGALQLLPGMIEGYQKLGEAASVMSEETIKRLEAAQDTWDRLGKKVTIVSAEVIDAMIRYAKQSDQFREDQDALQASVDRFIALQPKHIAGFTGLIPAVKSADDALAAFNTANKGNEDQMRKSIAAAEAYAKAVQDLANAYTGKALESEIKKVADAVTKAGGAEKLTTFEGEKLIKQLRDFVAQGGQLPPVLQAVVIKFETWHASGIKVQEGLGSIVKLLPNLTKAVEDDTAAWLKHEAAWASVFGSVKGLQPELQKLFNGAQATTKVPLDKWGNAATVATTNLTDSIDLLAGAFVQMAQISGDSFGGVARDIAQIVSLLDTASKMTHQIGGSAANLAKAKPQEIGGNFGAGSVMFSADASNAQKAAAAIQIATSVYTGALNVWQSTSQAAGKATNTLHGAVAGAKAGAVFGPYGVIIGAAAGAIIGFVRSLNDGRQAVQEFAKSAGGFDALHEKLQLLGASGEEMWKKLTQQTGKGDLGAAKKEIDEITKALSDPKIKADLLFLAISKGGAEGAAATAQIGPALSDLASQAERTGGLWSASFAKMIDKAKALGVGLDDVNRLVAGQQDKLVAGAVGVTGAIGKQADAYAGLKKALKDAQDAGNSDAAVKAQQALAKVTVTTQGEFDRLSRIELGAFNTLVASGLSSVDAMGQVGGGIDNLIKSADAFGLSGNEAFDSLKRWRELTTELAPVLGQIGSLNDLLVASANLGSLTADGFADLEAQGVSAFEQLTAAGLTSQEAEKAMKPLLESIIKLHEERGLAIDEETQKLIDQARADGVVKAASIDSSKVQLDLLAALVTAVGGTLPESFRKMAAAAQKAAGEIKGSFDNLDIKVPVEFQYNIPDLPSFPGQDTSGQPVFPQAAGGDYMVTKPTLFLAGEKGPERATFSGAGKTGGSGGGNTNVTIVVQAWDAQSVDGWLRSGGARQMSRALVPEIAAEVERLGISR